MERYNESSDVRQLFRGAVAVRGTAGEAKNESLQPSDAFKRVAAYCRVSTDSKAQETSIETQRAYFEHEIGNHPSWKLVQIYADQGVTGTISMKRPAFRQMIEDALAGKIDYILIKSISRFSRNTVDCLQYVRMLREKGVYLHFEKENIDTSSAYSEMLMTVLAAFAQEESVSISENIAWSFRKKYEAGIPRRFVLFGYRLDEDGEYRIVGEEAAVVREAFTLYEHGYSHKQIANAFNQKGYKSPTGLRWQETTIHRMLDNEKYVGDVMMQKRVTLDPLTHREAKNDQTVYPSYYVQDHHAAIIDRAQYNRVRKIRAMCNSKLGPLQYPYDDKLVCPICGQRLIQRRSDVLDNKSAWHCERNERSCERYVLNSVIVNEAVLNACKALNRDEIQVVIEKLQTIASLPLHVYQNQGEGSVKALDHPLYPILHDEPNSEMTSFVWRETMLAHLLLWGNAYCQIIRSGRSQILGLYPLLPDRMEVDRDSAGALTYTYSANGGQTVKLRPEDVLHIPGLGFDGIMGYSPIALEKNAIGLGLAAEEYGSKFFSNGARPSGILIHPNTVKDPKKLRDSWNAAYGGSNNSGRVAVLEENMSYTPISMPNSEAQFLETRKFQVSEICRIYRVPPHMVGDLEHATFSNIEHQSISFAVHTIRPWVVRLEQAMNRALFSDKEKGIFYVRFNMDGLMRGDYKSRMEGYAIGRQNGWLSTNDIRDLENMNPVPDEDGGNALLVNGNMVSVRRAMNAAPENSVQEGTMEDST